MCVCVCVCVTYAFETLERMCVYEPVCACVGLRECVCEKGKEGVKKKAGRERNVCVCVQPYARVFSKSNLPSRGLKPE